MTLNQTDELAVGLEPTPFELCLPFLPEPQGAAPVGVVPEVAEGFFEQIGLLKSRAGREDGIEGLPSLASHTCPTLQQQKLLAREGLPEASQGLAQFALSDRVEGFTKMPDHVELVVDDLQVLTAVGTEAVLKGPAHVNNCVGELDCAFLTKPAPETLEAFLRAPLHNVEHLGTTRPFQGADQGPVVVPLTNCYLVHAHHCDPIQRPIGLDFLDCLLVDRLDRVTMQAEEAGCGLDRRDLAHLVDHLGQGLCNSRPLGHKWQRIQLEPAVRAMDAVAPNLKEGQILPPREVLHLDPEALVCLLELVPLPTTFEATTQPLQSQHNSLAPTARLYLQLYDAMALNSKKPSEIMELHRVRSSRLFVSIAQWEYNRPDASFSRVSHKIPP